MKVRSRNATCGTEATGGQKVRIKRFLHCILIVIDSSEFRVLINDRVSNQVQRLESVQVLQLDVQLRYLIVLSDNLAQTLQFFDTA